MRFSILAATIATVLGAGAAQAAVIVNVQESGADVTIDYSGTIAITGMTDTSSVSNQIRIRPNRGLIANISGANDHYFFDLVSTTVHGPGGSTYTTNVTGDPFAFDEQELVVPLGYDGSTTLSGSMTFVGASLFSLGYTPGSYVTQMPNDTITTNVIAAAVPLPAAAPLLPGALALTGFAARRRKG